MGKLVGVLALCCGIAVLAVAVLVSAVVGGASSPSGPSSGTAASTGARGTGPALPAGWALSLIHI